MENTFGGDMLIYNRLCFKEIKNWLVLIELIKESGMNRNNNKATFIFW